MAWRMVWIAVLAVPLAAAAWAQAPPADPRDPFADEPPADRTGAVEGGQPDSPRPAAPATGGRRGQRATRPEADVSQDPAGAPSGEAQAPPAPRRDRRPPGGDDSLRPIEPLRRVDEPARPQFTRVKQGAQALPNEAGQVWREYDISPYTLRVTTASQPELAIIDWILRDTGYEGWFLAPCGLLNADRRVLRVYHTPEMHAKVAEIVDRFVSTEAETHAFGVRVVSVGSPNWRARSSRLMHPIKVEAAGVQAWLLEREDASLLVNELSKRSDYRAYSTPHLLVNNGQAAVVASIQPRQYLKQVVPQPGTVAGFQSEMGQIDEGFSLELSPLLSLDGRAVDTVIKCNVDQVERMISVMVDVPSSGGTRQQTKIEVPQTSQVRVHERFRWPVDQVLMIGMGVVATPSPAASSLIRFGLPGAPSRADLLVFVESRGAAAASATETSPAAPQATTPAINNRGRY